METNRRGFFGLLAGVVGSSIYTVHATETSVPKPYIPLSEARKNMYLQLHDKQVISTQTLMEHLGVDYREEIERLRLEANLPKYCTKQYEDQGFTISQYILPNNVAPAFKRNIRSIDYDLSKHKLTNYIENGTTKLVPSVRYEICATGIYEGTYFIVNYRLAKDHTSSLEEILEAIRKGAECSTHKQGYHHITIISSQSYPDEAAYILSEKPLELVEDFTNC